MKFTFDIDLDKMICQEEIEKIFYEIIKEKTHKKLYSLLYNRVMPNVNTMRAVIDKEVSIIIKKEYLRNREEYEKTIKKEINESIKHLINDSKKDFIKK